MTCLPSLSPADSLWHQEVVHYPSSQVYSLQRRVQKLESDLVQVRLSG